MNEPVESLTLINAFAMSCLKLEIREAYRGSRYRDTCISEIELP